jgi:hypothetical protein
LTFSHFLTNLSHITSFPNFSQFSHIFFTSHINPKFFTFSSHLTRWTILDDKRIDFSTTRKTQTEKRLIFRLVKLIWLARTKKPKRPVKNEFWFKITWNFKLRKNIYHKHQLYLWNRMLKNWSLTDKCDLINRKRIL